LRRLKEREEGAAFAKTNLVKERKEKFMILNEPAKTIETKGGNCYAIFNEKAGRVTVLVIV
jgi:hypothetical protein